MENFTNINKHIKYELPLNKYAGSERKRSVIMDDGCKYMIKFPDPARKNDLQVSYINNTISEYVGCHVFELCNIPVQKTYLGIYTVPETGKDKVACLCRDFSNDGLDLYEADKQDLGSLEGSQVLTFDGVRRLIDHLAISEDDKASIFGQYCDRTIIDGLIGNTDRHNGNWGFTVDKDGKMSIAPVYDCGSSYSPLLDDDELSDVVLRKEAGGVLSAVRNENGRRLEFHVLFEDKNPALEEAAKRTIQRIPLQRINRMIDEIPYITVQRKVFYKKLTVLRYEQQLIPLLERSIGIAKTDEYKKWNSRVISKIYELYISPFNAIPEGKGGKANINGSTCTFLKNSDRVFLLDENGYCSGFFSCVRSNLNIAKFVQVMRNSGNPVDIENLKMATRDISGLNYELQQEVSKAVNKSELSKTEFITLDFESQGKVH